MDSSDQPMLDPQTGLLSHREHSVKLTRSEHRLLARLMRSEGHVVSREGLLAALYDGREDGGPSDRILDVFICKLRGKAASIGAPDMIETVWGRGWRTTSAVPRMTLGLTNDEWVSLQVVVSLAAGQNATAAEQVRGAMSRAAVHRAAE